MSTTIEPSDQSQETRFNEDAYPAWKNSFSAKTRHDLIDEDLFAAKSVCGLLIAIIAGGVLLGFIGVTAVLWNM